MNAFSIKDLQSSHERLRKPNVTDRADIRCAVARFDKHSLNAVIETSLMDRVDSKYLLSVKDLRNTISALDQEYTALQIDGHRIFTYQNTYFDSQRLNYYLQHHNGKLNRHKVRYRRYKETSSEFIEIKFKTNKRRTIKMRESLPTGCDAESVGRHFVLGLLPSSEVQQLAPVLHVNYRRITLQHKQFPERITLDFDLRFSRVGSSVQLSLPDLAIAENKRYGKHQATAFQSQLKRHSLRSSSFSKYCIGCCLTAEEPLKMNRFRTLLRRLDTYTTTNTTLET